MNQAMAVRAGHSRLLSQSTARLIALLLPAALLAGAFGSEYFGGLVPCEMCWWQRYAHMVAFALAVIAFTAEARSSRSRAFTSLAALAIAVSGLYFVAGALQPVRHSRVYSGIRAALGRRARVVGADPG